MRRYRLTCGNGYQWDWNQVPFWYLQRATSHVPRGLYHVPPYGVPISIIWCFGCATKYRVCSIPSFFPSLCKCLSHLYASVSHEVVRSAKEMFTCSMGGSLYSAEWIMLHVPYTSSLCSTSWCPSDAVNICSCANAFMRRSCVVHASFMRRSCVIHSRVFHNSSAGV